jgi:hypothetical protein
VGFAILRSRLPPFPDFCETMSLEMSLAATIIAGYRSRKVVDPCRLRSLREKLSELIWWRIDFTARATEWDPRKA